MARGVAKLFVHVLRGRNPLSLAHAGIEPSPCGFVYCFNVPRKEKF